MHLCRNVVQVLERLKLLLHLVRAVFQFLFGGHARQRHSFLREGFRRILLLDFRDVEIIVQPSSIFTILVPEVSTVVVVGVCAAA